VTTSGEAPRTLDEWLSYLERQHPQTIALGLERVQRVSTLLGLKPTFRVITVGGTNGKGSTCAMFESILQHAGYRVGCYTSPHLLRYNERVRIDAREASDEALCRAFAQIEAARGGVPLTYFEYGTLAALLIFAAAGIDVAVLEVGLGGRLDAVNVLDTDCAIVTTVDIDHTDYLGDTREKIGFEKAGIFRPHRPAICGDPSPPATLVEHARAIEADLLLSGRDFGFEASARQWQYWGPGGRRSGLPYPALRGAHQIANAAACITALDRLRPVLPVAAQDIRSALVEVEVPARFQVLPGRPQVILDVAHNPHAARALANNLAEMKGRGRTFAVFSMLRDKDIAGVIEALKPHIDQWLVAPSEGPRGADAQYFVQALSRAGVTAPVAAFVDVSASWDAARDLAGEDDKIVVFGSFLTVSSFLRERTRAALV
jgi:dihydrofolate synthase/folylpolyglutamate synthase